MIVEADAHARHIASGAKLDRVCAHENNRYCRGRSFGGPPLRAASKMFRGADNVDQILVYFIALQNGTAEDLPRNRRVSLRAD